MEYNLPPREVFEKEVPHTIPDWERREQLIKGYAGQIRYCMKRLQKDEYKLRSKKKHKWWTDKEMYADIRKFQSHIIDWQDRINKCADGRELDFLGKSLKSK